MSQYKLVDGERVELTEEEWQRDHAEWEYYRGANGEPFGRFVTPDGTILEEDVLVNEDILVEKERQDLREELADDAAAAIQELSQSSVGQSALDLLIMISHKLGPIPLDFAKNNGWVEPWER